MFPKRLLALTLFAALAAANAGEVRAQWVECGGIFSGLQITGLAGNGSKVTMTTSGNGVFFSGDSGKSWQHGAAGYFMSSPQWIGDTCFAAYWGGAFGDGVSCSNNNGETWGPFGNNSYDYFFSSEECCIECLGTDGSSLLAGTCDSGIYRYDPSSWQGWVPCNNGLPYQSGSYPQIQTIASTGSALFAGTGNNGLFRSTDHGNSWQHVGDSGYFATSTSWTLTASGNTIVDGTYSSGGLYISTDGGDHWTNPYLDIEIVDGIAIIGKTILASVGGNVNGLFRSTDNGITWNDISNGYPYSEFTDAGTLATIGSRVLLGNGCSGIFVSSDSGITWNQSNSGLLAVPVCVSLAGDDSGLYMGAKNGGAFLSTDDGGSWTNLGLTNCNSGPSAWTIATFGNRSYISQGSGSVVKIGTNLFLGSYGVSISTDSGQKWTSINNGLVHKGVQPEISEVPVDTFFGQIEYRYDTAYDTVNFALDVYALGTVDTVLFAATRGGVFYSTNYGSEWIPSDLGLTNVGTFAAIGNILFAGTGLGVWKLNDQGIDWDVTDSILIDSVTSLLGYETNLFACTTHSGVYLSKDSGRTWLNVSIGLSSLAVWSITLKDSNLFVGTDSGVFHRPLSEIIPPQTMDTGTSQPTPVGSGTPSIMAYLRVYPNPSSQSTTIAFSPPVSGYAEVSIVNALGAEVAHLYSGELAAGAHSFTWSDPSICNGMYECLVRMNGVDDRSSTVQSMGIIVLR